MLFGTNLLLSGCWLLFLLFYLKYFVCLNILFEKEKLLELKDLYYIVYLNRYWLFNINRKANKIICRQVYVTFFRWCKCKLVPPTPKRPLPFIYPRYHI